jgi:alkanesulfonate monooxygenase SsuD/methylene tetrahydromethanopterin reductase-like flavin-dependent oxidoreductase (luciferase family)
MPRSRIKFGLILPAELRHPEQWGTLVPDIHRALDLAVGHYDSAWMVDHLQSGSDGLLESFTTLSYLAALHPQLKFGHTVVCQSFRNPALLAKMGATLQFLSGGRYLLGLGTGWNEEEYRAYGYEFPPAAVRVAQLEETIRIVQAMWTQPRATFEGQYYRVQDAACEPKPNPPPSIMVGAFKPKMLRLTAKYADSWNVSSAGLPRYRRLSAAFNAACAEVGRDPATVGRSWGGLCACAPTQAEAQRFAGDIDSVDNPEDDFGFIGTPRQVIDLMLPYIELGVDTFMFDCGGFPNLTTMVLLIGEVMPAINVL